MSSAMAADKPAGSHPDAHVGELVAKATATKNDLLLKGDAKCTGCHDEVDDTGVAPPTMLELRPSVLSIGKTKHGTNADSRTPTCTDCHGASETHRSHKGSGKPPKTDRVFTKGTKTSSDTRSEACLTCHQKDSQRNFWAGSTHPSHDVACSSCHNVHAAKDKVRDKATQSEVCFTCHKEQRAQVNKPSHHPVLEGKVACSDCHNVHGSPGPKLMTRGSVVETCYTCHMEKRGPFVHSHQPVVEDCSTCHNPHGTTAESLLKSRPPFLCNSCHTQHAPIQPSLATGAAAAGSVPGWWNGSVITQGKACLNCHTQIHGSNNPSGMNPAPQRFFR